MKNSNIEVNQRAVLGSETTQIAVQNNFHGVTPQQASQIAIDLFIENFPKLQDIAKKVAEERATEFCQETIRKLVENGINDFISFTNPDVQYILYEAQKNYARFGTSEMLNTLTDLIAKRIALDADFKLKVSVDRAIEIVPMLSPAQLDFLSLLFLCTQVGRDDIKTIQGLQEYLERIAISFGDADFLSISYLNMLGCLQLQLHNTVDLLSSFYKFKKEEIDQICPLIIKNTTGDYSTSYIGTILAITNAENKIKMNLDPKKWIQ